MQKRKNKVVVALFILFFALLYLVYGAIKEAKTYAISVIDIPKYAGQDRGLRIVGKVKDGSIEFKQSSLDLEFIIYDETGHIPVHFIGPVPDMFKADRTVIVQGRVDNHGIFKAKTLLTSCPTKYTSKVTS